MTHPVWKLLSDYDQPVLSLIEKVPMLLVRMRADGAVLDTSKRVCSRVEEGNRA